jgi:hypothetical protein
MTLDEFIEKFNGHLPRYFAEELFGEEIGSRDVAYPNHFIMICLHQMYLQDIRINELEQKVHALSDQ